jgi:hypothetical protein
MQYQTRWTKDQHAYAKAEGKALYAVGITGPGLGRCEVSGAVAPETATLLLHFAMSVGHGVEPIKALEEAQAAVAAAAARISRKAEREG